MDDVVVLFVHDATDDESYISLSNLSGVVTSRRSRADDRV
jgi:hypothetical protein